MKKFLCLLLSMILLSGVCFAAGSVDVKSMSDAELEGLRDLINDELELRGVDDGSSAETTSAYSPWYDYGLGQYLPNPTEVFGRVPDYSDFLQTNNDKRFVEYINDVSDEEFELYFQAAREYGFNTNIDKSANGFEIEKDDGSIKLRVVHITEETSFKLDLIK